MKRDLSPEEHEKIVESVATGDRIGAISVYIAATESGLTEAQEYVKGVTAEVDALASERPQHRGSRKGAFKLFGRG